MAERLGNARRGMYDIGGQHHVERAVRYTLRATGAAGVEQLRLQPDPAFEAAAGGDEEARPDVGEDEGHPPGERRQRIEHECRGGAGAGADLEHPYRCLGMPRQAATYLGDDRFGGQPLQPIDQTVP